MNLYRAAGALRPLEAYEALARFSSHSGDAALRLAMHAAVPQSFRHELLHLLKLNFVPSAADDTAAEADVLLAPFTDDLGGGYFQFDPEIRRLLLDYLGDAYADEPVLRARRVADFLLRYVERTERHSLATHDRLGREFLETQRWVGLAFARPEVAAEQLACALKEAEDRPELGARLHLGGLAHAVAIPLAHHRDLLDYALGIQALESGEEQAALELLEPLLDREITVGRITLQPRRVVAPAAEEVKVDSRVEAGTEGDRAFRVFISGSPLDLKKFREAAAEVCEGLSLVPVRWETLPPVAASSHTPSFWDSERIDLLLCLVGQRYRYVPRGEQWSGTETELNLARSRGIEILPLFVDLPNARPHPEDLERSRAFRERILREHGVVPVVHSLEEFRENFQRQLELWIQRQSAPAKPTAVVDDAVDSDRTQNEPPVSLRKLFLSYTLDSVQFARRLCQDLRNAGFEVWFDEDLAPGTEIASTIWEAIAAADAVVLVVSRDTRAGITRGAEWGMARVMNKRLIPVLLAGGVGRELPEEVARLQSLDFGDARTYEEALNELLQVLRQPAEPGVGPLYQVPPPSPNFTGREDVLAWLKSAVLEGSSRATVLVGIPASGKSAVAVQLAHDPDIRRRFADGVLWFRVGEGSDLEYKLAAYLDTRGVPLDMSKGVEQAMQGIISTGSYLVILDDVLRAEVVGPLTNTGSRSHVLVTARDARLGLDLNAQVLRLPDLSRSEALQLLASELGLAVDRLPPEAAEAARLSGGLPLTLRQIAAQVRDGASWSELLRRLRREGEVQGGPSAGASVALILEGLSLRERRLLAALTIFEPDEGIPESEVSFLARVATGTHTGNAEHALSRLVQLSLVERVVGAPSSIRLHPLVHKLASKDLPAEDALPLLGRLREQALLEDRSAWAHHYSALLSRTALQGRDAEAILHLGTVEQNWGRLDQAEQWYRESLAINEEVGNRAGMASSYHHLGMVAQARGSYEEAVEWYRKSLAINEELGNRAGMASSYHQLGMVAQAQGSYEEAVEWYRKSLAINEELGNRAGMASSYHQLGMVAQAQGSYEEAVEWYRKSLAINEELGNRAGMASSYHQLGMVAQAQGSYEEALEWYRKSLTIEEELGNRVGMAISYGQLGIVAQVRGSYEEAVEWYRESLAINEELGNRAGMASSYHNLGAVAQARGSYEEALEWYRKSLVIEEELGNRAGMASSLSQIGVLFTATGRPTDAVTWNLRSLVLRMEIGVPQAGIDLHWLGRQREALGAEQFERILREHLDETSAANLLSMLDEQERRSRPSTR